MRVPTIKELMREQCKFFKYHDGKLWYQIIYGYSDRGREYIIQWDFPVPVNDIGGGEMGSTEKAITMMRWIRKHIEYLNKALTE